jgi:hypothetical protein
VFSVKVVRYENAVEFHAKNKWTLRNYAGRMERREVLKLVDETEYPMTIKMLWNLLTKRATGSLHQLDGRSVSLHVTFPNPFEEEPPHVQFTVTLRTASAVTDEALALESLGARILALERAFRSVEVLKAVSRVDPDPRIIGVPMDWVIFKDHLIVTDCLDDHVQLARSQIRQRVWKLSGEYVSATFAVIPRRYFGGKDLDPRFLFKGSECLLSSFEPKDYIDLLDFRNGQLVVVGTVPSSGTSVEDPEGDYVRAVSRQQNSNPCPRRKEHPLKVAYGDGWEARFDISYTCNSLLCIVRQKASSPAVVTILLTSWAPRWESLAQISLDGEGPDFADWPKWVISNNREYLAHLLVAMNEIRIFSIKNKTWHGTVQFTEPWRLIQQYAVTDQGDCVVTEQSITAGPRISMYDGTTGRLVRTFGRPPQE